jgi:hypothetical protein
LTWLRALTVAGAALGVAACVSGKETTVIKTPVRTPKRIVEGDLSNQECRRLCNWDPHHTTPYRCQLVTIAIAPKVGEAHEPSTASEQPAATAAAPAPKTGEIAVLCATYEEGHLPSGFKSFGRRPLSSPDLPLAPRTAAEHYARAAYSETVAILSFQQLAFDLEALGAPASLVQEARQAARDEARHARVSLAVARRLGSPGLLGRTELPPWPTLSRPVRRAPRLFDVALENATGGCVNEIFGTWLQLHQAQHAPEPVLRAVAEQIARDEAEHAALAFRLFDFFDRGLTPDERREIRAAMREELERCEGSSDLTPALTRQLGLPERNEMRRIAQEIERALPAFAA